MPPFKPCPFCSHVDIEIAEIPEQPGEAYSGHCLSCGTYGPPSCDRDQAIKKWGMRDNVHAALGMDTH